MSLEKEVENLRSEVFLLIALYTRVMDFGKADRRTNPDGSAAPQSAVTADAMRATSNQFAVVQRKISTLLLNLDAEDD